jgi:hypothetical protein
VSGARIQLLLSDDWELRGDGSGNMRAIQFATARRLCDVYERHGLRGTFNVEIFQQLVHRRLRERHPELAELSDEWEQVVQEMLERGHDVQMHLHPQWHDAAYDAGRWRLNGSWSLLDYPREALVEMLGEAKAYLEGLLREVDPAYRCVSYRAGSWCIAPSPDALGVLADLGIVFDMSIVAGAFYDSPEVKLDYRSVDEPFLPYYPRMDDARRMSDRVEPIVCVPTHSFRPRVANQALRTLVRRACRLPLSPPRPLRERFLAASDVAVAEADYASDYSLHSRRSTSGSSKPELSVSDLSQLGFAQMREMLSDVRRRANASGWPVVPVILENHTKDVGAFRPLELFARDVAEAEDLEVITARELAEALEADRFPLARANAAA